MSNAFSFGKPTTTGATGGSLFGATSGTNTGGNIFGAGASNTPASAGFSFGSTPASTTTGEQKPLFGAPSAPTFSFGNKPEEPKPAEQNKPLFGSTVQTPGTPGSAAPSPFGSTTPAAASTQKWSFGNPSTTPAGPPPQATTFGASTGSGGMFGTTQAQSNQNTQDSLKPPTFAFGKPPAGAATTTAGNVSQAAAIPSLFGTAQPGAGGLFGAKPADKPAGAEQPATSTAEPAKPTFGFGQATATNAASTAMPSLFSAVPASTASSTAQAQQPLFGGAPAASQPASGGLFGKPPISTTSSGGLFGKPTSTTSSDATPKPTFSFPTTTTQASSAATPVALATTSAAPKPLFGGTMGAPATSASSSTSLFGTPATTTAAGTTAPAAANTSAPSGGLFSLGGASAPASSAAATATSSATSGGLFSLGGAGTTQPPSSTATTSAGQAASSTRAVTGLGASTLGASTLGPAPPAQSRLRNKTLDEILTRWATDLTRYTKDFKTHAETIAQWDQIIVDNSSKIDKLYVKTRTCEKQTMSVEMQLTAVENQQNELESWLSKYENDVDEMLAKDGTAQTELGGPDQERERTYKLAEKLGERLEDIGRDLESMVEEVNAANASLSKHSKADEPITQIVRILNSHLSQLQQIDQGTTALQAKVSAAQKSAHGIGYLNGGSTGEGRAAVDDFYKSYMGRR